MSLSSNFKIVLLFVFFSLFGLTLAILYNYFTYGRADLQFLELIADVGAISIDCDRPDSSPLFKNETVFMDGRVDLNLLLFNRDGKLIAKKKSSFDGLPKLLSKKDLDQLVDHGMKPIFDNRKKWVKYLIPCAEGWVLYLNDPKNSAFNHLILKRWSSLFFLLILSILTLSMGFWCYLSSKGKEATRVLQSFSEGSFNRRISVRRWESSFDLLIEFNAMAEKVASLFQRVQSLEATRSQLLSELAHDLRTPIASMMTSIDTLQEFAGELSQDQRETILGQMHDDVDYFHRLIGDLCLLAALDSESSIEQFKTINGWHIFKQVWESMTQQERDVECCEFEGGQTFQLLGDEVLLQRMFTNIVQNAIRYRSGPLKARVELRKGIGIIELENLCQGLDPTEVTNWGHKRATRLFHQMSQKPYASLGLGSSIARRIAEIHGGSAQAQYRSIEGEQGWFTVTIALPLDEGF